MTPDQQQALGEYRAAALTAKYATAAALATGIEPADLMRETMRIQSVPLTGKRPPLVECTKCGSHLVYVPEHGADEYRAAIS